MANPFDQFDAPTAPAAGNPFDQFDEPEPAQPSEGFLSRLMDGLRPAGNPMVEPEGMSSVMRRLPDVPGDVWNVFKGGVSQTAAAPGQILGVSPPGDTIASLRPQMEEQLRAAGFPEGAAKAEADRLMRQAAKREGMTGLVAGPFTALASPVFGAFRSLVSRPMEEGTGIPMEVTEAGAMVVGGLHVMARVRVGPSGVSAHPIGDLPRPQDFKTAADVLGSPAAEANTRQLWDERGTHPAEAVHDAQFDAFDRQQIAPPSFRVFHGSSSDFERFDASKIGSGEGAQAFGHGLYFAESEAVARSYAKARTPGAMSSAGMSFAELDRLDRENSNLYQIIIHADQDHFLDWDKRFDEQTPYVQEAIKRVDPAYFARNEKEIREGELGVRFKNGLLASTFDPERAAQVYRDAGIPGIKYFDQFSRKAGEGSRNYVLFDDTLAEITHKNGRPLIPTKTAPIVGSVVPRETPRSELAKSGQAHIDDVLDHPTVKRSIDNTVVDDTHTVPNSWGASNPLENPTLFLDKDFPRSLTVDGVTFDPAEPASVHENTEQFAIETLMRAGWNRDKALSAGFWGWGEPAEDAWYAAHGIDPERAEATLAPIVDRIAGRVQRDNVPAELFRDTYPDGDPQKAAPGPIPKLTDAEMEEAKRIITAEVQRAAQPVGAAPTPPAMLANLPPYSVQPPPPRGSLVAAGKQAVDDMFALGRNLQGMLDPMAAGSPRAMVVAKDAMNAVRRIRWEHARLDQEIMNSAALKAARERLGETQQDQLARMWNAGDEESVLRQTTGSRPDMGWSTLEPEERRFMEHLDSVGQDAWMRAQTAGLVEGEGLPAYMPRMLLNMALVGEGSPKALNELGRNVFTRTAQMLKRNHLMAEDTEAAAKEVIRKRMEDAGKSPQEIADALDKVTIGRNIRALPLASARLQEAAIWRSMINNIEEIGRATGQPIVSVGTKPQGWFTIEGNPAFTKWGPRLEKNPATGTWGAITNDVGDVIFDRKPIYMHPEFKGPMLSILDDGPRWMDPNGPNPYGALMTLKGKAMTAILNSPLIHNEVVWSKVMEAAGGREWLGFGLYFRGNRLVTGNPGRAGELIERGLNPMGPRGAIQDITSIMEEPNLRPGRSWTSQILAAVPDLFNPEAGDAVRRSIDKMGDFWHNTLLWDRVRDVQFGLADHMSDKLVAKGLDRLSADRIATHFSNIIVGSIPKESMSAGARMTANLLLFSRSFTLGNLSTFKQAAVGLPKPVLAQIGRDLGIPLENLTTDDPAMAAAFKAATSEAKSAARWKAINTIALSAGLFYIGNALFQHAFNIAKNDSTLNDEMQGYARRFSETMEAIKDDSFELHRALARMSPTWDNEPGKSDRVHMGYDKDGTAIYLRLPFGKFGEEMVGYPSMPLEMLKRKLSPILGTALETLWNDQGFGKKIYNDTDRTALGKSKMAFAIAKHAVMRELPEGQIQAAADLLHEEGDPTVNKLRLIGPALGFTASVGYPGGPLKGEVADERRSFEARFELAWPDIKKQVQRGDVGGATQAMMDLGTPMREIRGRLQAAMMPGNISGRALNDFFSRATPEQQQRFFNAPRAP